MLLTGRAGCIGRSFQGGVAHACGRESSQKPMSQARRVLDNLCSLLRAGGSDPSLVLKTTCLLADIADAPRFNEIYREYFPVDPPARSTFAVAALSAGFLVEVEAVAAVAER